MNRFVSTAYECVVIGSGIAGLTAAALLANDGLRTLATERHNVPGGCASFYQRLGFRFDVGATLVGGFGPRGVHRRVFEALGAPIDAEPVEPSMAVHFSDETIFRYGDERWASERMRVFGPEAEPFWQAQERIADAAWDLSTRFPALPADARSAIALVTAARLRQLPLAATLGRTVASLLPRDASPRLRAFLDAQLLITAQTDAAHADLAYGATALDLAREGTFHLSDGVSGISTALARSVRRSGSDIAYGTTVVRVLTAKRAGSLRICGVELADGTRIAAKSVIAALPLDDLVALCPELRTGRARAYGDRIAALPQRYGAFMLYVGLPAGVVPDDLALHHQTIGDGAAPLGEGNTAFLSFSGPREMKRARGGGRAVTLSTHTDVARWERASRDGTLPSLRARYEAKLRAALERVLPGASRRAEFTESATPLTFARYTGRARGLVGGLPQTADLAGLHAFSHRTPLGGLFVCGDSTFPGQSTVGATLSGVAAARAAGAGFRPASLLVTRGTAAGR